MKIDEFLENKLAVLQKTHWMRNLEVNYPENSNIRVINEKKYLQFCSNDYLGLSHNEEVIQASINAGRDYGFGSTGSRLISGNTPLHIDLENKLATFLCRESSLVLSSGYAANIAAISSLMGPQDVIFSDELNHSSILSGIKLSGATQINFSHLSLGSLERYLKGEREKYRNSLIISESLFSMDGDIPYIKGLVDLKEKYDSWLMIDEAHSIGVFGPQGRGLLHQSNLNEMVEILSGTFSKSFGGQGGFIAGSKKLIDFIAQRGRSFFYSTGLSPMIVGGLLKSLEIIQLEEWRRQNLFSNIELFKDLAQQNSLPLIPSDSQVQAVLIPNLETLLHKSESLRSVGFWVHPIRKPTAPTPRFRVSLNALHTSQQINELVNHLSD
jgi:8-amino-7-oxononanoate synthase